MAQAAIPYIITAIGTAASIDASKAQARAQERIGIAKAASEFEIASKQKRQQVREQRIKAARLRQAAEVTGVAGSSGELGAMSVMSTQFATNTAFAEQRQAAQNVISDAGVRIARAGLKGKIGGAVASIGMQTAGSSIFD